MVFRRKSKQSATATPTKPKRGSLFKKSSRFAAKDKHTKNDNAFNAERVDEDDITPPVTPDQPEASLNVTVLTTKGSPSRLPSGDGEHSMSETTISDISGLFQRNPGYSSPVQVPVDAPSDKELDPTTAPSAVASSRALAKTDEDMSNGDLPNGSISNEAESKDAASKDASSTEDAGTFPTFRTDTVAQTPAESEYLVSNLLGIFDDACAPCKSANDLSSPARMNLQALDPTGAPPIWGLAPSDDEDTDDDTATRTTLTSTPAVITPTVQPREKREPASEPAPAPKILHDNFELVLDKERRSPESASTPKRRGIGWRRKSKPMTEEEREASFRAVFGTDPTDGVAEVKKPKSKPSLVKRFSQISQALNKIPEDAGSPERKRAVSEDTQPPVVDTDALVGEEVVEEKEHSEHSGKENTFETSETKATEETKKDEAALKIISDIRRVTSLNSSFASEQKPQKGDSSVERSRSTPLTSVQNRESTKKSTKKPTWKAVVDSNTGATYYYHRFTRQTTWSKPEGFDEMQTAAKKALAETTAANALDEKVTAEKEDDQAKSEGESLWTDNSSVTSSLRTGGVKDHSVEAKKKEIKRLLMDMSPPDPSSVDKLIEQYDGRENDLLAQLKDLVQSQPFDEPIEQATSFGGSDFSPNHDTDGEDDEGGDVIDSLPHFMNERLTTRTRTANTNFTGISAKTDKTDKISNVKGVDAIATLAAVGNANTSVNSSFTSTQTPPAEFKPKEEAVVEVPEKEIVRSKRVLRDRELRVEEFSSGRYGLKAEQFEGNVLKTSPRKSSPEKPQRKVRQPSIEDDALYMGDNEAPATPLYESDSISALSDPNMGFMQRKEKFEESKRKTLDDAIRKKDWELAAIVTDDMRGQSFDGSEASSSLGQYSRGGQFYEWTQSELDKFISENDWDAVAKYIAHMRDSNAARKVPQKTAVMRSNAVHKPLAKASEPRKSIGARSLLQIGHLGHPSSSFEGSESSYFSDDYSSASSLSSDVRRYPRTVGRKEFEC